MGTPSTEASTKREPHRALFRFAVVAQAVLAEACSRKEFFDELADNLEPRSDRYTNQSDPGITAHVLKARFLLARCPIFRKQSPPLALG